MTQQDLFPQAVSVPKPAPTPLTGKQIEDAIFDRALKKANGKLNAVDSAVRAVLREGYGEFKVENRGRWAYLYNTVSKRIRAAIRGAEHTKTR